MSGFTSEGFESFPNTYMDNKHISGISTMPDSVLERKTYEYGAFLQRTDIMDRARAIGDRILNHLLFELAYRDGIYNEFLEDSYERVTETTS